MSPVTLQAAIRMYGPVSDHGPSFFSRPICRDFASHGTRSMNTAVELLQVSCGAVVGRCRSCQKTRSVQARPTTNPRKLCVFHSRFAAKSRMETNFSRVYLPNGCSNSAEILQLPASFYERSNTKKRER